MFDNIRKALQHATAAPPRGAGAAPADVAAWARQQGLDCIGGSDAQDFAVGAEWQGCRWRLECTAASRDFIEGRELRARAELGAPDDRTVIVMSRRLKETLENDAYAHYTGSLQTTVGDELPEEVRWLAMFDEVGWSAPPKPFWDAYAVIADRRSHAQQWLGLALQQSLLAWPGHAMASARAQVPFMLVLLRGKVYLRMQYVPGDLQTLGHAMVVLRTACESALGLRSDTGPGGPGVDVDVVL